MLEEPCSQDVGRDFRKNAPLLLVLFAVGVFVLFAGAFATAYARVARVTCKKIRRSEKIVWHVEWPQLKTWEGIGWFYNCRTIRICFCC